MTRTWSLKQTLEGFTDQFVVVGQMCSAVNTGVCSVAVRQIFSEGLRHFLLFRLLARLGVLGGAHAWLVLRHYRGSRCHNWSELTCCRGANRSAIYHTDCYYRWRPLPSWLLLFCQSPPQFTSLNQGDSRKKQLEIRLQGMCPLRDCCRRPHGNMSTQNFLLIFNLIFDVDSPVIKICL